MAEMERITIRLARRDLARLDRLRGCTDRSTDRSTYLRRLLRRAGSSDEEPEEDNPYEVTPDRFEESRRLTIDA
jgi:hypothetical protein